MDNKFTDKIKVYLETPKDERDVVKGAELLLQINRNRVLFNNAIRRPDKFAEKIDYELRKHYGIRIDEKTQKDVALMVQTVMPVAEKTLSEMPVVSTDAELPEGVVAKGKREDHDSLPDDIKKLWDDNADLWPKIKTTFEQLKKMNKASACDRYEYLKVLDAYDKKYRKNMAEYDAFVIGEENDPKDTIAEMTRKVSAARSFLTDNKKKLSKLLAEENPDDLKIDQLKSKMQERIDLLLSTQNIIDEENMNELLKLGLRVKLDE